jgi:iron complex transport system substrate-binding protein
MAKKNTKNPLIFIVLIVSIVLFVILPNEPSASLSQSAAAGKRPSRIISVIPAVTEMLFALGAGPEVVAVGTFDQYPPEVAKLPRVGALLDPDLERILSLRPDLVVVYESQSDFRQQLERAAVPTFVYKHAGLADITETIRRLGARIGREVEAAATVRKIEDQLAAIRKRVAGRPKPRTLLVFDRDALALRGIYASGGVGFLQDMLDVAGGENVFGDVQRQSLQATTELILARRPDVVIEFRSGTLTPEQRSKEIAVWQNLPSVPAVRSKRITIITDQRAVVPGPRVAEGTELIARAIHPDAFDNFRLPGSGVPGSGVQGSRFKVQGSGFRVLFKKLHGHNRKP